MLPAGLIEPMEGRKITKAAMCVRDEPNSHFTGLHEVQSSWNVVGFKLEARQMTVRADREFDFKRPFKVLPINFSIKIKVASKGSWCLENKFRLARQSRQSSSSGNRKL